MGRWCDFADPANDRRGASNANDPLLQKHRREFEHRRAAVLVLSLWTHNKTLIHSWVGHLADGVAEPSKPNSDLGGEVRSFDVACFPVCAETHNRMDDEQRIGTKGSSRRADGWGAGQFRGESWQKLLKT